MKLKYLLLLSISLFTSYSSAKYASSVLRNTNIYNQNINKELESMIKQSQELYKNGEYGKARDLFDQIIKEDKFINNFLDLSTFLNFSIYLYNREEYVHARIGLEKSIQKSNSIKIDIGEAAIKLGNIYFYGLNVNRDYKKAIYYWELSNGSVFENMDKLSLNKAYIYENGLAYGIELHKAFNAYSSIATRNSYAAYKKAEFLMKGWGTISNYEESLIWYGVSCQIGYQESCNIYKKHTDNVPFEIRNYIVQSINNILYPVRKPRSEQY